MNKIYLIIVNGKPESGKTTFERACVEYLQEYTTVKSYIYSSIDYIKDIYKKLGWDGIKTDKARKDLSILKQMWIDNNNGPLLSIINKVMDIKKSLKRGNAIIFIDIREDSEIIKYKEVFDSLNYINIECVTIFIDRSEIGLIEYGNKSDDNIGNNMSLYDYVIYNDSDIENLKMGAKAFINDLNLI